MIAQDFACFESFDLLELLRTTAWRMSALKAVSSTSTPSWVPIARRVFPSRLASKRQIASALLPFDCSATPARASSYQLAAAGSLNEIDSKGHIRKTRILFNIIARPVA